MDSGQGTLGIMVMNSWSECSNPSPSANDDALGNGGRCTLNMSMTNIFLLFFFDKGESASQGAEIAHDVYGADTVTVNYAQFWFLRFRSGIFDFKDAPHTGRPVLENVDKITEIIEVDQHVRVVVSPRS
ncbi:histone-lysine N-methyltransferase SETMAR [Trichonephila clavipes]|nr:histone-lysine N-methyltransferase SETMAR [Trichonephila clavipes]